MNNEIEALKYPIGRFKKPTEVSKEEIELAIKTIADFPDKLRKAVEKLDKAQLDTPYRPEGWTVRQVVHHCADSHMNAYMRFKLALTEETPIIKPYDQARWATLTDTLTLAPDISLGIIKGIHTRWVTIMQSMSEEDWDRQFVHPEHNITQSLRQAVKMYAWHAEHHLAHVTRLMERMGWK